MIGQRPPTDRCLSNLALDHLLGGEMDEPERRASREHMEGCPRCAERHRQLLAERAEFPAAAPSFSARAPKPRRRAPFLALGGAGALAAAAAALFLLRPTSPPAGSGDAVQVKGGVRLGFYVKRGDRVVEGRSGDPAHPGEAVRFAYTSDAPGYLVVASRDGAGRVSVYYPDGADAAPVGPGQDELLPGSIILDDVLGPEVVVAIHCAAPLPVARVARALEESAGGQLSLAGCATDRLILEKRR